FSDVGVCLLYAMLLFWCLPLLLLASGFCRVLLWGKACWFCCCLCRLAASLLKLGSAAWLLRFFAQGTGTRKDLSISSRSSFDSTTSGSFANLKLDAGGT
ncbi:hypothetical protein SOVF_192580, partial [Spinacia oleracea]